MRRAMADDDTDHTDKAKAETADDATRATPKKLSEKLLFPADWVDETAERSGTTVAIIGSPFPKPKEAAANGVTTAAPLRIPPHWKENTSAYSGTKSAIIGSPFPNEAKDDDLLKDLSARDQELVQ